MKNIMFYNNFKDAFSKFYESEEYDRMLFISSECNKKIYDGSIPLTFKDKLMIITNFLRNEKNNFGKTIAIIDTLMSSDSVASVLKNHKIDTDKFIDMFTKYLLMSRMNKSCDEENEIKEILKKLSKFYDIGSASLCVYKIYELQALKELNKEKSLS